MVISMSQESEYFDDCESPREYSPRFPMRQITVQELLEEDRRRERNRYEVERELEIARRTARPFNWRQHWRRIWWEHTYRPWVSCADCGRRFQVNSNAVSDRLCNLCTFTFDDFYVDPQFIFDD